MPKQKLYYVAFFPCALCCNRCVAKIWTRLDPSCPKTGGSGPLNPPWMRLWMALICCGYRKHYTRYYYLRQEVLRSVAFVGWLVDLFVREHVLEPNISNTVGNRGSVPIDHQQEMIYGESNGHVLDDVTRPYCRRRATGGQAEVAPYERFSSYYYYYYFCPLVLNSWGEDIENYASKTTEAFTITTIIIVNFQLPQQLTRLRFNVVIHWHYARYKFLNGLSLRKKSIRRHLTTLLRVGCLRIKSRIQRIIKGVQLKCMNQSCRELGR